MTRTNPLADYTNVTPKTFNTKGENAESKEGMKSVIEKYLEMGYRNLTALRPSSFPEFTQLRYKLYSAPSQEVNNEKNKGLEGRQNGLYAQRITGMSHNSEDKKDPTIPEKTIDASNKPNPDGVLNEALPLLAGASVGTALCYAALAIGGTVALPFLVGVGCACIGGALLFGAYRGGANYFNKEQPPKVDTPSTKVELVKEAKPYEPVTEYSNGTWAI